MYCFFNAVADLSRPLADAPIADITDGIIDLPPRDQARDETNLTIYVL
jgi:hypothetical protein